MSAKSLENSAPGCCRWAAAIIITTIVVIIATTAVCVVIFIGFAVVGRISCEGLVDPMLSTCPGFDYYVSFVV